MIYDNLMRFLSVAGLIAGLFLTPALAQDQVEKVAADPPAEVAEGIRSSLSTDSYQVKIGGKLVAEFWMRKEVPTGPAGTGLGFNFQEIPFGAVLGVVRLPSEWADYKELTVAAGVYILRYGQMPADGNHMGVAVYRDFAQLIPAGEDRELGSEYDFDQLVDLSARATGTPHPAVMALFPVWDDIKETSLVKNELDQWTLAWKLEDRTIGFVVEGHGEM